MSGVKMLIRMVNSSHHLTEYAKNFTINSTNCTGLAINGTAHATNCTEHAASKHQGNDYRFWAGIAVVVILCFIVSGFSSEENRNARRSRRILNGGAEPTDLESLHNTRRAWATVDLEKITVHHISLAEDSLFTSLPGVSRRDRLQQLPPELRTMVYAELDYRSALKLAETSRFYYDDTPAGFVPKEHRATYVFYAETFAHNQRRVGCFKCLRVLPVSAFTRDQWTGAHARFGESEFERCCKACAMQKDPSGGLLLREMSPKVWLWKKILRR